MDVELRKIKDEMLNCNDYLIENNCKDSNGTLKEMSLKTSTQNIAKIFEETLKPLMDKILELRYFKLNNRDYFEVTEYSQLFNGNGSLHINRINVKFDGDDFNLYKKESRINISNVAAANYYIERATTKEEYLAYENKINELLSFKEKLIKSSERPMSNVEKIRKVKYLGTFKYRICKYTENLTKEEYKELVNKIDEATKIDAIKYINELKDKYIGKYVVDNEHKRVCGNKYIIFYKIKNIELDNVGRIIFGCDEFVQLSDYDIMYNIFKNYIDDEYEFEEESLEKEFSEIGHILTKQEINLFNNLVKNI